MLPVSSLANQLAHSASLIVRVRAGESMADGMLNDVPVTERPAVQELLYTYLRTYGLSDALLGCLLQKPLADTWVHALLGQAINRLMEQPKDAFTTVNQAVEAVGQHGDGRFKSLSNGVLRSFLRQMPRLMTKVRSDKTVLWTHPGWWIRHVQRDHPENWESILQAGNSRPPMGVRVNLRRTSLIHWLEMAKTYGLVTHPISSTGVLLPTPVSVNRLPGFQDGMVSVQDLGAQEAANLLNPPPGSRVLDACAAPGGKTAHLLERANVSLTALDISPERCQRIQMNLDRLSLSANIMTADCCEPDTWWNGQVFDAILADVPCTASGVVRRHPDSKWLRRESDIRRFALNQRKILTALSRTLAPGGTLLYATCSVFREENQQQIEDFLSHHKDFHLMTERVLLPNAEHDGFYYALLKRVFN